jgi:hypothetical protein
MKLSKLLMIIILLLLIAAGWWLTTRDARITTQRIEKAIKLAPSAF